MNAAEAFALSLLDIAGDLAGLQLVDDGKRPAWETIERSQARMSSGERLLVDQAMAAWRGLPSSLIASLGRLDRDTQSLVIEAFDRAVAA